MLEIWQTIILGIVEGITEFLPISSTGHLILTSKLLNLPPTDWLKSFEIAIQLGAILAVVVLYWRSLLVNWQILKKIIIAFIPTAIIGLALYQVVKQYLLGSHTVVLWALLIGGAGLIVFELWYKNKLVKVNELEEISYPQALLIGLAQSLAIVPGVSRAAATIVGGLILGLGRKTIVEFSFLLAVPTMLAATGLDLLKSAGSWSSGQFGILAIGFVTSFVVALLSIKWLIQFIQKHTFISFGVYRILIALIFWLTLA
ncbi:MAG: undecaprenyl-diphosphate phosphatase [Patescibacteria group bacterium]